MSPSNVVPALVMASLRQQAASTGVTVAAIALACGLMLSVFSVHDQAYRAFTGGASGIDAVLGARGSKLQLVLNAVFHLDASPGNVPWSLYQEMKADPRVVLALPYAVGDNVGGFRVVGTTTEVFSAFEYERGRRFVMGAGGRPFDPDANEAVLGARAARELALGVGGTFQPRHGLDLQDGHRHDDTFTVVGVLEPTGTPADNVLWIPVDGMFHMSGHVLRGDGQVHHAHDHGPIPDAAKEVSAVLLKFRHPQAGFVFDDQINRQGKIATLAWPVGATIAQVFDRFAWLVRVLGLVAWLVAVVACGSVFTGLWGAMAARRREFAILRALGAGRLTIWQAVMLEALVITAAGIVVGFVLHAAIMVAVAAIVRRETGVELDVMAFHPAWGVVPAALLVLGGLAGTVPAISAYRTDVASHLAPPT